MADLTLLGALLRQIQQYNPVFEGDPEGVVDAPLGATGHRSDGAPGTCVYAKTTAAGTLTGWVAVA